MHRFLPQVARVVDGERGDQATPRCRSSNGLQASCGRHSLAGRALVYEVEWTGAQSYLTDKVAGTALK